MGKIKHAELHAMTKTDLVEMIIRLRQKLNDRPRFERRGPAISAIDRNGKSYSPQEMSDIFERLYHDNPKALLLMFPTMTQRAMWSRAKYYGLAGKRANYTSEEDAIIRDLHPDYSKISHRLKRSEKSVKKRAGFLDLAQPLNGEKWSAEEDALLIAGEPVPNRPTRGCQSRRSVLGIKVRFIRAARAMSGVELKAKAEAAIPRGYPEQVRSEAVMSLVQLCLEGRCALETDALRAAGKKAISAVYKLHPERGAPTSLDAQIYDDGGTTVGDRIHSDAFHF